MGRSHCFVLVGLCVLLVVASGAGAAAPPSLETQCENELSKVADCLGFATGKAAEPTKQCCTSVTEIKTSHPVCLCYFIVQTHNGSEQIKSLGIQEAKIMQLPSACKLPSGSIKDCPKLLNIPTSSPDYAIFTKNATSPAASATTASPATKADDSSTSKLLRPQFTAVILAVAVALFARVT